VDRQKLQDAVAALKKKGPVQVPLAVGGEYVKSYQLLFKA
jgi:1-pyrroline-5-carboxylate dehydrogenase